MAIPYQLMCEQSGTDQKRVLSAGKTDVTQNSDWNVGTMEVIYPTNGLRVPWDLRQWIVYWNVATDNYDQGAEIIKESQDVSDFLTALTRSVF